MNASINMRLGGEYQRTRALIQTKRSIEKKPRMYNVPSVSKPHVNPKQKDKQQGYFGQSMRVDLLESIHYF